MSEPITKPEIVVDPRSFRTFEFLKDSAEEIASRTVTCEICPVSMQCQAGQGGMGYICTVCRSTGVNIDTDDPKTTEHCYVMDCAKHNFHDIEKDVAEDKKQFKTCPMCDGRLMQHEVREPAILPYVHLVFTAYAKVTPEERKKVLVEAEPVYRKEMAEKKVRDAEAKKAADEAKSKESK